MNETEMNIAEKSLRYLAEKWLPPIPVIWILVVRFGRMSLNRRRHVRIKPIRSAGNQMRPTDCSGRPVSRRELRPVISQQNDSHDEHVMHS